MGSETDLIENVHICTSLFIENQCIFRNQIVISKTLLHITLFKVFIYGYEVIFDYI